MMQVWSTATPLVLPIDFPSLKRLDLEFVGVRRDHGSFTAFVFVNADELPSDAGRDHETCVGSFTIFAPGFCWGAEGHCDWERPPVSAFDRRGPHHLIPINVSMEITDGIGRLGNTNDLTVSVHAALRNDPEAFEGVLVFDELRALAYQ
jgi:hypothetical protein